MVSEKEQLFLINFFLLSLSPTLALFGTYCNFLAPFVPFRHFFLVGGGGQRGRQRGVAGKRGGGLTLIIWGGDIFIFCYANISYTRLNRPWAYSVQKKTILGIQSSNEHENSNIQTLG